MPAHDPDLFGEAWPYIMWLQSTDIFHHVDIAYLINSIPECFTKGENLLK